MKLFLFLLLATMARGHIPYVDFELYENFTVPDIKLLCLITRAANVSDACWDQLQVVCANGNLLWNLFDASSKFPYPGLSYSTRTDFGNFDQCFSIDYNYDGGRILGEYCAYGLIIPDLTINSTAFDDLFKLAVCRPDACNASDYNSMVNSILNISSDSQGLYIDGLCQTKETPQYTSGDIIVLIVFGFIMALMALSTLYDIYIVKQKLKPSHPLYVAFSVISNGKKLLHISRHSKSKENIEVFHGLRVISMLWIVAGHGFAMWELVAVTNAERVDAWPSKLSSFYATAAPLAVDTFFYMAGFLLAFQYFKREIKPGKEQASTFPGMVLHRYLRLTPAVLMIYLVIITFFVHLGSGPRWIAAYEILREPCINYWWRYFLYVQNYFDADDMCLLHTWYLSADMQLFLVSPIVIIPLSLMFKNSGFVSCLRGFIVANIFFTILPLLTKLLVRDYTNEYDTHSRLIVYFMGAMMGFFMRVKIDTPFLYMAKEDNRPTINFLNWLIVILGMLAIVVCYQDQFVNHGFESVTVFESLMRPAWGIGLSWITYSCYHGHGGLVNWILCRPIFQVLGRLTYCIYLVHVFIIGITYGQIRDRLHFSDYGVFYLFCGHYIVSVLVAIFWTLAFESPLIIIEKYIFGNSKPTAKEDPSKSNEHVEEGRTTVEEKG